jgi:hypothetical protein
MGFDHQPLDGGQPRDSPKGSSPIGDPLREPPFNPPIESFGWPTPNPCMFIFPWYQSLCCATCFKISNQVAI